MKLNEFDRPGAREARKRVGRGIGSGLGKTAGAATRARSARGVSIKGFEGGQMPLYRRLPKRGFNNIFRVRFNEVNLGRIQTAIDKGKLDADQTVTPEALIKAASCGAHDGVRLLGKGESRRKCRLRGGRRFEVGGRRGREGRRQREGPRARRSRDGRTCRRRRLRGPAVGAGGTAPRPDPQLSAAPDHPM
jgi:large subunit ribosomal protein L15